MPLESARTGLWTVPGACSGDIAIKSDLITSHFHGEPFGLGTAILDPSYIHFASILKSILAARTLWPPTRATFGLFLPLGGSAFSTTSVQQPSTMCSTTQAGTKSQTFLLRPHFLGDLLPSFRPHVGPSLPVLNPSWPPLGLSLLHLGRFLPPTMATFRIILPLDESDLSITPVQQPSNMRLRT